jgi:hypothetical protein
MAGFKLRAEAGVLEEEELTAEQRQAGEQVFGLIKDMLASDDTVDKPEHAFLPRIDKKRSSRVLLVDGGRGSGKTALLITLIAGWRKAFLAPKAEDEKEKTGDKKADRPPKRWMDTERRVVPVGLLDLHPLPPSTNLLFHIIGRFERVVEWLEGDGKAEKEPAAWHFTADGELGSRKGWQKLLKAAAAGWDGNVKERGARLDLEAYTIELEEAERQRLNLVDAFAEFVDALVKDFGKRWGLGEKEPALFVLGVDDADMDPSRSVELLDTVRMLWHPRVAFVLTGHSELFIQVLAEHVLGELRRPLRGHYLEKAEVEAVAEMRPVMGLTTDIYDKIIPPGHRCALLPIPPQLRLEINL